MDLVASSGQVSYLACTVSVCAGLVVASRRSPRRLRRQVRRMHGYAALVGVGALVLHLLAVPLIGAPTADTGLWRPGALLGGLAVLLLVVACAPLLLRRLLASGSARRLHRLAGASWLLSTGHALAVGGSWWPYASSVLLTALLTWTRRRRQLIVPPPRQPACARAVDVAVLVGAGARPSR